MRTFLSAVQAPRLLPLLETLRLEGYVEGTLDRLDLSACGHLRGLALVDLKVDQLGMPPACNFSFSLLVMGSKLTESMVIDMSAVFGLAGHSGLRLRDDPIEATQHFFHWLGHCRDLKIVRSYIFDDFEDERGQDPQMEDHGGPVSWLVNALPASGQPLRNLRSIIMEADSINGTFPAKLPNLELLAIMSRGLLELEFEDPLATVSALRSFYALGQPLIVDAVDMLRMSSSLIRRGLILDAASAGFPHSCIYLRGINAVQLSVDELCDLVWNLVFYCTCGACFECLYKAGSRSVSLR